MDRIKIGVIGVGNMGKNHVRLTTEMNSVFDLVGVYDVNPEKVRSTGYKGVVFDDPTKLMDASDAVIIAAPSSLHKDLAIKAAKHDVHLLVEKPLGLSKRESDEILKAYHNNNKVLMVGHVERFNPVIIELEKILENENIIAVTIERCSPKDIRISDTDVISDLMIHDVDILVNALNPNVNIVKRFSLGRTVYSNKYIDYAQTLLEFDNGVLASVTASRTTEDKIRMIKLHCKESFIYADLLNKTITISSKTRYKLDTGYNPSYRQENMIERVFVPNTESLKNELIHFANCITSGESCKTDGRSAAKSLMLLDQIRDDILRHDDIKSLTVASLSQN